MSKMIEEWRPVGGYEGYYEVSNTGKIRSVERTCYVLRRGKKVKRVYKSKELKPEKNKRDNYCMVVLSKEGKTKAFQLHRLIGFAFPDICGEWFEGAQINHKDWDRTNNVASNLEWLSFTDNAAYKRPPIFRPRLSRKKPLVVKNLVTGEEKRFLHRYDCADFLGMKDAALILYYLKRGTPYKQIFLIQYLDSSVENYDQLKWLNSPTEEQISFYGS